MNQKKITRETLKVENFIKTKVQRISFWNAVKVVFREKYID